MTGGLGVMPAATRLTPATSPTEEVRVKLIRKLPSQFAKVVSADSTAEPTGRAYAYARHP